MQHLKVFLPALKDFMHVAYKFDRIHFNHRSFSICSSYENFHEKILLLKDIIKKNEKPQMFIDICTKNYLSKLLVPKRVIHSVGKKTSIEIRLRLQKLFKNYVLYCSLEVAYQSKNRVVNVFNFTLKDAVNNKLS